MLEIEVRDRDIHCTITVPEALKAPVFCFSLMTPGEVVSGGTPGRMLGGHMEVRLPDLAAGRPHLVVVAYRRKRFAPFNRAWLPLGAYLRHDGGVLELSAPDTGVRTGAPPVPRAEGPERLLLCPPPTAAVPTGGTVDASRGFACDHEAFAAVAGIDVRARTHRAPFLTENGLPVTVETDPALPPEGYFLVVSETGVHLSARDRAGVLYGAVTLRHLQITHGATLPAARIADGPRFGWRGQQLDCARNFQSVETILEVLDLMALLKLNRFHWHFADDEAFRLEVTSYPEIWQKTAYRGEGELFPGVRGGGQRAGGSYSRADVARIVAHAKRLNIEVMPEIEMPAHAFALTQTIPELRDPADTSSDGTALGYPGNTVNPAVDKTWEVLPALASEVASWFPFAHLHLGCDELSKSAWQRSPAIAALKQRLHLASNDDVQAWMMARMGAHLARAGIRPAAWQEARKGRGGGIGHNAILFAWLGQEAGVEAARAGYDVVMCPAQHAYLDMAHTGQRDDWGAFGVGNTVLEETVGWNPVPEGAEDIAGKVIGVQGNFWSEFTPDAAHLWPMLMPRLLGVATTAWSKQDALDGPGLRAMADGYRASMDGFWSWNHSA